MREESSGELLLVKEPRVPDVARVRFSVGGVDLQIDFLRSLHGISASDLIRANLESGTIGLPEKSSM